MNYQRWQRNGYFCFENLKPGKYVLTETFTPEGYQGLKEPIELIIREDGSVTIDGEKVADVLISGEKNNQITFRRYEPSKGSFT